MTEHKSLPLFAALDLDTLREARRTMDVLSGAVDAIKIGPRLYAQGGAPFLKEIVDHGFKLFLDLKLHDIPNTVRLAVETLADLGIFCLTLQTAGGRRLPVLPLWMARAASPLLQYMARRRRERPLFTRYSLYTLSSNDRFSHDKATCELGYRPRDLFQTLRDTVAWLREKGPRAGKLLGRRRLGGHRGRRAAGPLSNLT